MICPHCGATLSSAARFCTQCGQTLAVAAAKATTTSKIRPCSAPLHTAPQPRPSRKHPLPSPHSLNPYRPHRPRHRSPSRHPHSPARNSPRPSRPSRRFPNQSPHKKLLQLPSRRQKCQSPLRPEKFPPPHLLRLQHRLPALLLRPRLVLPSPAHLSPLPPAHPAPRFSPALRSSSSPTRCSRSCSPRVRCRPPQSALPSA